MPKLSDALQSRFLKQTDFPKPEVLTITRAEMENVAPPGAKPEEKYVLFFREYEKGLVLNTQNNLWLTSQFGDDVDSLVDQKVVVYVDRTVMFQGKRTGGLRLREVPKPVGNSQRSAEVVYEDDEEESARAAAANAAATEE
jgi:hypothetical protein